MAEENKENKEKEQERKPTPYFDSYKQRYKAHMGKKREERQKQNQEGIIQKAGGEINAVEEKVLTEEQKIIEEVRQKLGESTDYLKEPKHIRVLKVLAILAVLGIIGYILFQNFLISQDFNYFYDIGSQQDANKPYLIPLNRVSEIINDSSINYRNLFSQLVYFDAPIPRGSEDIYIAAKFKDNFPNSSAFSLGAKDKAEWHYTYKPIYYSSLSELENLFKLGNVYLINDNLELLPAEMLMQNENISIATDLPLKPSPNKIENWQGETIINTSLRGAHTFYIYISGNLSLNVKKQDINLYSGSDELNIYIYDLNETLIANTTIPDDGISEAKKGKAIIQSGSLEANNLSEGVYKLVFTDFDGLIREIRINTKKIVAEKIFLADNSVYNTETKKSKIYTELIKNSELRLMTYHKEGIQNITYNNLTFNFYQEDAPLYLNLTGGSYTFSFPANDIIVSYPGYFAFSKESYFEPFKQRIIKPEYSIEWLKNNADYFVSDYQSPLQDGDWLISETEFNIKTDSLFVKDNKLSLLFNLPHLSQESYQNYTIPIDWINITVHKPGLFEKWGWT